MISDAQEHTLRVIVASWDESAANGTSSLSVAAAKHVASSQRTVASLRSLGMVSPIGYEPSEYGRRALRVCELRRAGWAGFLGAAGGGKKARLSDVEDVLAHTRGHAAALLRMKDGSFAVVRAPAAGGPSAAFGSSPRDLIKFMPEELAEAAGRLGACVGRTTGARPPDGRRDR